MADIVLIHGAWHGAWAWDRFREAMLGRGHRCHAASLTGLGDRAHLLTPEVDPDLHVADVVGLIEAAGLARVVLVAHSYGGLVAAGVADRLNGRVDAVVALDAYVPDRAGESVFDYVDEARRAFITDLVEREGEGWKIPPTGFEVFTDDPDDIALLRERLTAQPLKAFKTGVTLTAPAFDGVACRVYVRCRHYPNARFDAQRTILGADPHWRVHDLDAYHNVMMTDPATVAGIVTDAAQRSRSR